MWNLRALAAAIVVLPLLAGSGCVVSQAKYNAEHQKVLALQKDLEKAKATQDKLTKKAEADLTAAKEEAAEELKKQTDALQATIKEMQATLAKTDQASKQQAAGLADKAKEISRLNEQLKAEQDLVLKLTQELEAAKKAAAPAPPPH